MFEPEEKPKNKEWVLETAKHEDGTDHFEILACGHMNNLKLEGRVSGVCPKGCKEGTKEWQHL